MECGHTCGIDRHKRQADKTLLFEYRMESPTFSKEGALTKMVFDMFANSVGLFLSTQNCFQLIIHSF